jgi:hypothetical protein
MEIFESMLEIDFFTVDNIIDCVGLHGKLEQLNNVLNLL